MLSNAIAGCRFITANNKSSFRRPIRESSITYASKNWYKSSLNLYTTKVPSESSTKQVITLSKKQISHKYSIDTRFVGKMVETDESPVAADGSNNNSSSPTVNLYELAASCLAASIAASEPIRRIAFGSLHSPARTPAVTADDYEIASVVGTSTLVVVEEEGDVQHKTDSTRSLDTAYSAVSAVYARSAPSRQSSVTSIASRSKSDGTLVTDADGAAQRLIVHAIRSVDSRVTIVGEESSEEENRLFGDPDLWSPAEDNSSPSIPPAPSGGLLSAHQWEACWRFAQEEIQIRVAQNPDIANVETDVDPSRVSIFGKHFTTYYSCTFACT